MKAVKNIIIVVFSINMIFLSLISLPVALGSQNLELLFVHLFIIALVVYGNISYFKKQKKAVNKNADKDSSPSSNGQALKKKSMNIFNIKKDIGQIKDTGRQIEAKAPLFSSAAKSIFVILKWLIILLIIIGIPILIWNYKQEQERKERESLTRLCEEICFPENFCPFFYVGKQKSCIILTEKQKDCYFDCLSELK